MKPLALLFSAATLLWGAAAPAEQVESASAERDATDRAGATADLAPVGAGEGERVKRQPRVALAVSPFVQHDFSTSSIAHHSVGLLTAIHIRSARLEVGLFGQLYGPFQDEPPLAEVRPTFDQLFTVGPDIRFDIIRTHRFDLFLAYQPLSFAWTRPVGYVDGSVRNFAYTQKLASGAGLGVRLHLNDSAAVTLAVHDTLRIEYEENPTSEADNPALARDSSTWFAPHHVTVNTLDVQLGLTFYLPSLSGGAR